MLGLIPFSGNYYGSGNVSPSRKHHGLVFWTMLDIQISLENPISLYVRVLRPLHRKYHCVESTIWARVDHTQPHSFALWELLLVSFLSSFKSKLCIFHKQLFRQEYI